MKTVLSRSELAWAVVALLGSKLVQYAIDAQPLLFVDSTAFIMNGAGFMIAERSYLYGRLIGVVALPLHSLQPLVALQMLAGALAAGTMGYILLRDCGVRYAIALAAALLLAWDPTQIVHEHLVMTETFAMLGGALFLATLLSYLARPQASGAAMLGALGVILVGLRIVYVPLIWCAALLVPLAATRPQPAGRRRWRTALPAAVALVAGQLGYQGLTGYLSGREPAYHYRTGAFLLANVAPLVNPEDAVDPQAEAVIRQWQSDAGPSCRDPDSDNRAFQLWNPGGLVDRFNQRFQDDARMEREATYAARNAIRRNPGGLLRVGAAGLADFFVLLGVNFPSSVAIENGSASLVQTLAADWEFLAPRIASPTRNEARSLTPSRQAHLYSRPWCWLQLLSPVLGLLAIGSAPPECRWRIGWIVAWGAAILGSTCLGSPVAIRYLHPLSLTALVALAVLTEAAARRWARLYRGEAGISR